MTKITVDAYDERHPEHEAIMDFQCDTGLDICLLPNFEVENEVESADIKNQPSVA